MIKDFNNFEMRVNGGVITGQRKIQNGYRG